MNSAAIFLFHLSARKCNLYPQYTLLESDQLSPRSRKTRVAETKELSAPEGVAGRVHLSQSVSIDSPLLLRHEREKGTA